MFHRLRVEYDIADSGGLMVLSAACQAFQRAEEARAVLDSEGCTFNDRFGQPRPHPMTVVERDSRAAMLGALKQLALDVEPGK